MKNKMTIQEFQKYVISEATRLYKIEQLKEQKEKLENKIKTFCNLPADIKRIKEMIRQKRNEYDELNSD